jgi:hypothetical protein
MDDEGLLIEVAQGRVARVYSNGVPLPGGATVTYDSADARALPVRELTHTEEIERFVRAQREGRTNTQRHGVRKACDTAYRHYQAIAQATGVLAGLLADMSLVKEGDPTAIVAGIKEAVNRVDDEILREVRKQLLQACDAALELRVPSDVEERPPAVPAAEPPQVNDEPYEPPRVAHLPR